MKILEGESDGLYKKDHGSEFGTAEARLQPFAG